MKIEKYTIDLIAVASFRKMFVVSFQTKVFGNDVATYDEGMESLDEIVSNRCLPTVKMPVVEQMKALSRCFLRREFQVDVDRVNTNVFDSSNGCATILDAVYHQIDLVVISNATEHS